jgi:propionyl-CoA carboxylase alpha chain
LRTITKVLVANRGEIALRVMRTCREQGIRTVAVYSDADRKSPHVTRADEAYRIGPPPSSQSYLQMDRIIETAVMAGAEAIHPGYGFLSENAEFSAKVRQAGLIFIGPPAESIRAMGDKTAARALVKSRGVPTVPGSPEALTGPEEAAAFAQEHGFPVLLKAAAGGGGKGMRVVHTMEELAPSLAAARGEAKSAFGDDRVYIEKYLENPRHIEFQIIADDHGHTLHLGERECSIQRRHQKVVEEAPSVIVTPELRKTMGETAVRAAEACGYRNAGTIEFLVDRDRQFYFLEMNTRLQVEHPVTELRTGLDLVALQLNVAMGKPIPFTQEQVQFHGHAVECRICAEDPAESFLPSTGTITRLRPALGPGIREDRGVEEGGEIPVFYDSMISKLVAWGSDRTQALSRMVRALREYEILGVTTNIPVCLFVLQHEKFVEGDFDTHFLGKHFDAARLPKPAHEDLLAAALACAAQEGRLRSTRGDGEAPPGGPPSDGAVPTGWTATRMHGMRHR